MYTVKISQQFAFLRNKTNIQGSSIPYVTVGKNKQKTKTKINKTKTNKKQQQKLKKVHFLEQRYCGYHF